MLRTALAERGCGACGSHPYPYIYTRLSAEPKSFYPTLLIVISLGGGRNLECPKRAFTVHSFETVDSLPPFVDSLPPFIAADNLKTLVDNDLRESTTPVFYRTTRGQRA